MGSGFLQGVWWYRNTKIVGATISVVVRKSFDGCRSHVNLLTPLSINKVHNISKEKLLNEDECSVSIMILLWLLEISSHVLFYFVLVCLDMEFFYCFLEWSWSELIEAELI